MTFSEHASRCKCGADWMAAGFVLVLLIALAGCEQKGDGAGGKAKDPKSGCEQKTETNKRIDEIEAKIRELTENTGDTAKLIEYCEGLYEDADPRVTELAAGFMVNVNVNRLQAGEKGAAEHLERAVNVLVGRESLGPLHLALSQKAAGWIERDNQIKRAKTLWKLIEEKFAKHENPEIAESARDVVDRARRRTGMLGSRLELAGPLVRGGELDWSKYRGKVVLVDFWATWCPPCVAEMPHLKKLYDKYHERGFEILGVSLDSDETTEVATTLARDAVQRFFSDRDLPWDSIYFADEKHQGWENPLAQKYGIGGLPQGVLVGRDGKVIAYNALGEVLDKLLAEEFKAEVEKEGIAN